jgi:hypothetical protein
MAGRIQIAAMVGVLIFAGSTNSLAQLSRASGVTSAWRGSSAGDVSTQFGHKCKHHKHRPACGSNRADDPQRY